MVQVFCLSYQLAISIMASGLAHRLRIAAPDYDTTRTTCFNSTIRDELGTGLRDYDN
ncbi:MAG: hypothetical protein M3275_01025 [Thermoproteota archaeon]|nr:hypothetical protein [Thermoproteota archaeon]